jgi:hypothetical protein
MTRSLLSILLFIASFCSQDLSAQTRDTLLRFDANPAAGFNYPYFLFIPAKTVKKDSLYLFVEANNTGTVNDDFTVHEEAARVQATSGPLGNYFSRELQVPYLVPVFPRPEKKWKIYTHMLDRDALCVKKGPMKRIDLQLVAMITDAKTRLKSLGFKMRPQILLSGFSSSGVFANRFALLHPNLVFAYSAGGINGLLMMPFAKWNNEEIDYPLGTADYQNITGNAFDFEAFKRIHQFLYMGENDTNDAVLFDDGYSKKERAIIFASFGEKMLPDRWFASQLQYKIATKHAQFRTYSGVGHEINEDIKKDLLKYYVDALKSKM